MIVLSFPCSFANWTTTMVKVKRFTVNYFTSRSVLFFSINLVCRAIRMALLPWLLLIHCTVLQANSLINSAWSFLPARLARVQTVPKFAQIFMQLRGILQGGGRGNMREVTFKCNTQKKVQQVAASSVSDFSARVSSLWRSQRSFMHVYRNSLTLGVLEISCEMHKNISLLRFYISVGGLLLCLHMPHPAALFSRPLKGGSGGTSSVVQVDHLCRVDPLDLLSVIWKLWWDGWEPSS